MNNAAANKFEYVVGLIEEPLFLQFLATAFRSAGNFGYSIGFGLDVTNANTNTLNTEAYTGTADTYQPTTCIYNAFPLLGYHYIALLEFTLTQTPTILGDNAGTKTQTGATGWINS